MFNDADGNEEDRQAVIIAGNELGDFPDTEEGKKALRAAVKDHLMAMRGEWIDCPVAKNKVEIRKRGIKKNISLSGDPKKLKLLTAIKSIISQAYEYKDEKNLKPADKSHVLAYHYIRSKVSLGGEVVNVKVIIEEDQQGMLHYDLNVDDCVATDSVIAPKNKSWNEEPAAYDENLTNTFDAVNGCRQVLNLFIEGEEPEYLDDEPDEQELPEGDASQGVAVKDLNQQINDDNASIDDKDFHTPSIGNDVIVTKVSENQWTVNLAGEAEKVEIWNDKQAGRYQASTSGSGHGYGVNLAQSVAWAENYLRENKQQQPVEQQNSEELDPSKLKSMPEIIAEAKKEIDEFADDKTFLQSVIDGKEDFSSDDFLEKLIAVGEKHEDSPSEEMQNLVEQAAQVYSDWVGLSTLFRTRNLIFI